MAKDEWFETAGPVASPQAKASLHALQSAERALLKGAARQAQRTALDAISAMCAQRKQSNSALIDADCTTKLADILKTTPPAQHQAAITRLQAEKAAKLAAMIRDEDEASAQARRAALGALSQRFRTEMSGLAGRHRAERAHMALRGQTPIRGRSRIAQPRISIRRVAAHLCRRSNSISPK